MQLLVQLSLDRVRAYMREHDLTPYQMAKLAGLHWETTHGIFDNPNYQVSSRNLEKLERLVVTQPHPQKGRPGRPVGWRKPKEEINVDG